MADPDEIAIHNLRGKISRLAGSIGTSEQLLQQYQADYDNYQEKLIQIGNANERIFTGSTLINAATTRLNELSSGNKSEAAKGLLNSVCGLLGSLVSSGTESIKIYIAKDVETLKENYEKEYKSYYNNVDTHNGYVDNLRGYGVYDVKKKELTITKKTLI